MDIVRYSKVEMTSINYCGESALIRFGKNPADYGPWNGSEASILLFSNMFYQRFPKESQIFLKMVEGMSFKVGGASNESVENSIGMLSETDQIAAYNNNRAYVYCTATHVPYTLNFMEAMMSGIPIVATNFKPTHQYYEIPDMLRGCGLVAESVAEARAHLRRLLEDMDFAKQMSRKTRIQALSLFSEEIVSKQWALLLGK